MGGWEAVAHWYARYLARLVVATLRVVDPLLERTVRCSPCSGSAEEVPVTTGTIKKVDAERSFGFIAAEDTKEYFFQRNRPAVRSVSRDGAGAGAATLLQTEKLRASLLRIVGPSGALDVWLGAAGDHAALEADIRDVSARGIKGLPALAMALGDVATKHKLEVRVIPRKDSAGSSVFVLFGSRKYRAK